MIATPTFLQQPQISTLPQGNSLQDVFYESNSRDENAEFATLISGFLGGSLLTGDLVRLLYGSPSEGGKKAYLQGTTVGGDDTSLESLARSIADGRTSSVFQEGIERYHGRAFRHVVTSDYDMEVSQLYARSNQLRGVTDNSLLNSLQGLGFYNRRIGILIARYLFSYVAASTTLTTKDGGVTTDDFTNAETGRVWTVNRATNHVGNPKTDDISSAAADKRGSAALNALQDIADAILDSQPTDNLSPGVLMVVPRSEVSLLSKAMRNQANTFVAPYSSNDYLIDYVGRNPFAVSSWARRFYPANIIINAFGGELTNSTIRLITCPDNWFDDFLSIPNTMAGLRDMPVSAATTVNFTEKSNQMRYLMVDTTASMGGLYSREASVEYNETKWPDEVGRKYLKEGHFVSMLSRYDAVTCGYINFGA